MLSLGAMIAPRYGHLPASDPGTAMTPVSSNGKSASPSPATQPPTGMPAQSPVAPTAFVGSRADFSAPFLFASRERRAAAKAAAARASSKAPSSDAPRMEDVKALPVRTEVA